MADPEVTPAPLPSLGKYRGKTIVAASGKLTNPNPGIELALKIDPQIFEPGSRVPILSECMVGQHTLSPIEDEDPRHYELSHNFIGGLAIILDEDLVAELIARQKARIQDREDMAEGKTPPLGAGEPGGLDGSTGRRGGLKSVKDPAE